MMPEFNRTPKIAISSQKGGVAKTTTSLSLGVCMAEIGLRVLVVDLDPQAHLTRWVGINPDSLRYSVAEVLLNQATLIEVSKESDQFNLDVIPANRGLLLVEKILYASKGYEYRLKKSFEGLNDQYYDIVLFDCPPSFGPLTVNGLAAAQMVIIPVVCDYFSAQSLQSYLKLLTLLRNNINPEIQHRLLVTLFDARTKLSRLILNNYREAFGNLVFETEIRMDNKLRESAAQGRPITEFSTKSRGTSEYRSLAKEIMECLNVMI
jgi:chromosome partitioning protein